MRLLFVTPYYFPELKFGGPPKRIHALSRGLTKLGHEVRVVTFNSENQRANEERSFNGVAVQYLPWVGKSLRQIPLGLSTLQAEVERAEVVHCYGLYNLLCPAAAHFARRRARPYFLEPMGMYVPRVASVGWKKLYHALFTNRMARNAQAVIATSPLEQDELTGLGDRVRLVVRRNGVDLEDFENLPPASEMRGRWGAAESDRVILYLGRLNAKKNLEELIGAFRAARLDDAVLVIAGPAEQPSYFSRLQQLIDSGDANPRIILDGAFYGRDHRAALAAADLFVLPSLNENFGNAAAEAIAAGVPVLLTETCGVAPLIHGRGGLAIPLGHEALVQGLKTMLHPQSRAELTAQMSDSKRALSWDEPIRQTEALYQTALQTQTDDKQSTISKASKLN
jgi:glycosyltransferase involved in cell wall biosynthesis